MLVQYVLSWLCAGSSTMIIGPVILIKFIQKCFINSDIFSTTKNSVHHLQRSFGDNSEHRIVASSLTRPDPCSFYSCGILQVRRSVTLPAKC